MNTILLILAAFSLGGALVWFLTRTHLKKSQAIEEVVAKFNGLSQEALKQNNEIFLQLANSTFEKLQVKARGELESDLIKPVKDTLQKFDTKLGELEKSRIGAYSTLKEQVSALLDTQKELRNETGNLVKALRAPIVRGRWGEIQLRRVVELAGMLDRCDFYEQESVTTEEGRLRPDLLVRLPGKKNIVVDAKAPLSAYLDAIETQDEAVRLTKLKEHAKQVRTHVTLLSRKSYWDQFQPTPEFLVLFLPGEAFFSAALEHDPSLIEMGVDKQVILATPTTLIALLRAVAYGWRQENLSQNAQQISALGRDLYKRVADMAGHWSKVGKSLGGAVQAYNKAVGSLESRVLVSARRFKDLESTVDREIEVVDPVEQTPRQVQASEMLVCEDDAEESAGGVKETADKRR